jgi:hypothetical protein
MGNEKQIQIRETELEIQNVCSKINSFVGELNIKTLKQTETDEDWSKLTELRNKLNNK